MNLKDRIAAVRDLNVTAVDVPEWGVTVHLKELNVGERVKLFDVMGQEQHKDRLLYVYALLFTLCEADGSLVYTVDDYDQLASKNGEVVLRLGRQAVHMNRLLSGAVEDAKKKSETTPTDTPSTNSLFD